MNAKQILYDATQANRNIFNVKYNEISTISTRMLPINRPVAFRIENRLEHYICNCRTIIY